MANQASHFISVDEYLKREETALLRHEYFDGEIFSMSGGTPNHSLLISNIIGVLKPTLRDTGCLVRESNMGIKTADRLYTYPDVVISCKPEKFDGNFLLNPIVIIEVLSDSTEAYDRGKKFEKYRRIESFREYLLIAEERMHVEHYVRGESLSEPLWNMQEFSRPSNRVFIEAANAYLTLDQIYADITLENPALE